MCTCKNDKFLQLKTFLNLKMIHMASSFSNQPKLLKLHFNSVTDVHCTNPAIGMNKRSRIDQMKIFKNTFKNRKLSTILTIWSFQR